MRSHINNPQSICLLRLSAIGDVCHAVASVQAIQARWPQAKITWIIGKIEYQLLKGLPEVEFIIFDKKAGLKAYLDLRHRLLNREFDILLHMQVALRASLATLFIRAKERWGFDRHRAKEGQWLFTNRRIQAQIGAHVAEGFLAFAQAIGVAKEHQLQWQMPIEPDDLRWQQAQLAQYGRYIVISPAASKVERNWLTERYAALAQHANKKGFTVVLCGGPTSVEQQLACEITTLCDFKILNLVGKTTLKQLLVVLQQAQLLIAPDTGPAHMAVTVATPVIGLYAHSNPKRTGPYLSLPHVVSVYDDLLMQQTGQSVQDNRWGKRLKGDDLMANIQLEDVIIAFDKILSDLKGGDA